MLRLTRRLIPFMLACLVLASVVTAVAASNTVPVTHLGDQRDAVDANALKPPECAALNLTSIVVCPRTGGNCDGTDASDLIIGSPYADNITANKGDDCLVGGGGDDFLKGEQNTDVCIGGPGNDSFHPSCETQIQ
jgi:Ca2+-binding RTX toxin-like protein